MPHPPATSTVQADNDRLRITLWRFAPGEATGAHRHEYDYIVLPLTTGEFTIVSNTGEQPFAMTAGTSYTRLAGVEHDVVNTSDDELGFVEIELK